MSAPAPRVAIVSDALVQRGGAERVVEAMAAAFPKAPIFALLYSAEAGPASLKDRVIPTWLNRVPGATRKHRAFLPLYPAAIESLDLSGYDVILSSHHTVAKGVKLLPGQLHVCYCHTPMRALWERPEEEIATLPAIARPAARALFGRLRAWDVATVPRVDRFLANSTTTQGRIARHWGRESTVLHPPIDVERLTPGGEVGDYYLVAARPVPYKRIDIAVEAARTAGRRVIVVGGAAYSGRVDGVEYRGHVSDDELLQLMRGARALLFPQEEDFGMTPLEVNATGRPVIAYAAGGALETVVDGVTGLLVRKQTVSAFANAIAQLETLQLPTRLIRQHALEYTLDTFIERLLGIVHSDAVSGSYHPAREGPIGQREASAVAYESRKQSARAGSYLTAATVSSLHRRSPPPSSSTRQSRLQHSIPFRKWSQNA